MRRAKWYMLSASVLGDLPMNPLLDGFGAAINIFKEFAKIDFSYLQDRTKIDQAIQSLRQIYFHDKGIKAFLSDISKGKKPNEGIVEDLRLKYYEATEDMSSILKYLEVEKFEASHAVMIDQLSIMDNIRYTKISLRIRIQTIFASKIGDERNKNSMTQAASDIIDQIEILNKQIKELEAILVAARKKSSNLYAFVVHLFDQIV